MFRVYNCHRSILSLIYNFYLNCIASENPLWGSGNKVCMYVKSAGKQTFQGSHPWRAPIAFRDSERQNVMPSFLPLLYLRAEVKMQRTVIR